MPSPPRKCVFCGSTGVTREHVLGAWATELLAPRKLLAVREAQSTLGQRAVRAWEGDEISYTIRRVCRECNSGWMSEIEAAAKLTLEPMILGHAARLGREQQRAAALWLTKVALLYRYALQPPRPPSRQMLDSLYLRRTPPDGTYIWVAAYSGGQWLARSISHRLGLFRTLEELRADDLPEGELVTITLGHFVAQVAFLPSPEGKPLAMEYQYTISRIWPVRASEVDWPPGFAFDDSGLDDFSRMILRP